VVVQQVEYRKACRNNRDQGEQMAGMAYGAIRARDFRAELVNFELPADD